MTDFIALDTETANPNLSSICQVGIAEFHDGMLVDEREWLVDPEDYFHGMNVRIHGIHASDVKGKPIWKEVYPELRALLNKKVIVTHTPFDRNSVRRVCDKYQTERLECVWVDSAKRTRQPS